MAVNQSANRSRYHEDESALSNDVDFFRHVSLRWGLDMINADDARVSAQAQPDLGQAQQHLYWIDPATRVAGVIMMQILPFADRAALKVYREFEQGVCRAARRV